MKRYKNFNKKSKKKKKQLHCHYNNDNTCNYSNDSNENFFSPNDHKVNNKENYSKQFHIVDFPHMYVCVCAKKLFIYDDDDRGILCCVGEISNVASLKVKCMT